MAANWVNPVTGTVGQGPGYRSAASTSYVGSTDHQGYDIRAPSGTQVVAATGGTVTRAEYSSSYGNVVYVNQPDGSQQRYAHLSSLDVSKGDQIGTGDNIGEVGSTGHATGPHLHYENRGPDGQITGNATGDDSLNKQYQKGNSVTGGQAGDGTPVSGNGKKGDGTGDNTKKSDQETTAKEKSPIKPSDKDDITGTAGNYKKTKTKSITSIMPTHEPWPGHPQSTEGPRQALKGSDGGGGSGGSGGGGSGNSGNSTSSGDNGKASSVGNNSTTDMRMAAFTSTLEATGRQNQSDVMQSILNRAGQNYGGNGGAFNQATAKGQYAPISSALYGSSGGDAASDRAYGRVGASKSELQGILSGDDWAEKMQQRFGKGSASDARAIASDYSSNGPLSQSSASYVEGRTDFRGYGTGAPGEIQRGGKGGNVFRASNRNKKPAKLPRADPGMNPNAGSAAPSPATGGDTGSPGSPPATGASIAPQAAAQTPTRPATSNFGLAGPKSS